MAIYRQKGENNKYPREIETWKFGELIPEWLSDTAKVLYQDGGTGEIHLDTTPLNTGGFEIKDSGGIGVLVKVMHKEDFVCRDLIKRAPLFTLTPIQLNLLYYGVN